MNEYIKGVLNKEREKQLEKYCDSHNLQEVQSQGSGATGNFPQSSRSRHLSKSTALRSVKIFTDTTEIEPGEEQDLNLLQNSSKEKTDMNGLNQKDHANQELVYVYTETDPVITIMSENGQNLTASFNSKDTSGSPQSVGTQVINMSKQNVLNMRKEVRKSERLALILSFICGVFLFSANVLALVGSQIATENNQNMAVVVAIANGTIPLGLLASYFIYKEKLTIWQVSGSLACLAGILILSLSVLGKKDAMIETLSAAETAQVNEQ